MKILIGVPTSGYGRYIDFENCLDSLILPEGFTLDKFRCPGGSVAKNRNIIIREAIQKSYDYLMFLDDDMIFESNLISQLLSHNKNVVTAHCLIRYPPFRAVIIEKLNLNNDLVFSDVTDKTGLIEIPFAGTLACTLINCKILYKMEQYTTIGWLHSDELSEDISFYVELMKIGEKAYCDLDCHVGHHIISTVWPDRTIRMGYNKIAKV